VLRYNQRVNNKIWLRLWRNCAPAETVNTAIKDLQENNQFSVLGLLKGSLTNIILLVSLALLWRLFQKQAFITIKKVNEFIHINTSS
jgi:hypothetical protein